MIRLANGLKVHFDAEAAILYKTKKPLLVANIDLPKNFEIWSSFS